MISLSDINVNLLVPSPLAANIRSNSGRSVVVSGLFFLSFSMAMWSMCSRRNTRAFARKFVSSVPVARAVASAGKRRRGNMRAIVECRYGIARLGQKQGQNLGRKTGVGVPFPEPWQDERENKSALTPVFLFSDVRPCALVSPTEEQLPAQFAQL